jgi:hypothetical protein
MKTVVKGLIRNEKGYVLIAVLILLVVGGLILTPLLGLMSTGLLAGKVYEKKMDEYYAADAGVEDAIWKIQTNNLTFVNDYSGPLDLAVNGKNVTVEVYREDMDLTPCVDDFEYQILSTAATHDASNTAAIDSTTTIDAHITTTINYYPSIMDQLITIQGDLTDQQIKNLEQDLSKLNITCPAGCNCSICGGVYDYSVYDTIPAACRGCVAVYNFPNIAWPTAGSLNSTYWEDVKNGISYNSPIELSGNNVTLQTGYYDGTLFEIFNTSNTPANLTLTGTLYSTGDTEIGDKMTGKDMTLNLNGHTIFVSSTSSNKTGSNALIIGGQCTVKGPGVIIAVGDIKFTPKALVGGEDNPIFVLSVDGMTTVQPSGEMWGAIAGRTDVVIGPGNDPSTIYPTKGFGNSTFPRIEASRTYNIASWEINPD